MFLLSLLAAALLLGLAAAVITLDPHAGTPPSAARRPRTSTLHGETRVDDYYWLREKESPEVRAYLEAENAYTAAVMAPTEALQEQLYEEMLARIQQTDLSVPYRQGRYSYYTRTEAGKQYPIYCRKLHSGEGNEEVTLDLNELGAGKPFVALGAYAVSDNGRFLAYSIDTSGFREYEIFVKDLASGAVLPDALGKARDVEWAADNRTIFYTVEDAAKRAHRVYRYRLGSGAPHLVYEETDALFSVHLYRSHDRKMLFIHSESLETAEVRFVRASRPCSRPTCIEPRRNKHDYSVEHQDGRFLIRTNLGARTFRLVSAPVESPGLQNWTEEIGARRSVILERVTPFARHWALFERCNGLPRIRILDLKTRRTHTVRLPEATCSLFPQPNPEYHTNSVRFQFSSYLTPQSVYAYDMRRKRLTLLKRTEVLGGYDPSQYQTDYVFATAPDGRRIPISLVWKKELRRPEGNPLFLTGYGSYGFPNPIAFSSTRLSLLDRGIVFARAHIRGGGELGERWHDEGKMLRKRNTFTDFIACAERLVQCGVACRDRMVAQGGSAGGLLIGAVVNMRPDLFCAAIADVPFVDVINTMLDETLPLTIGEWIEWGNPRKKREYQYMRSYCPYSNVVRQAYPHLLVTTSLNDSQVMYWEPAKYTAKLRALKTDDHVLLLKTNMDAGHGGASGRYDALREIAFAHAFALAVLGLA